MSDPKLKAITRDGYYTDNPAIEAKRIDNKSLQQARAELEAEMGKAAFSAMVYNGLNVNLERGQGDAIKVNIAAGNLQWADSGADKSVAEVTVLDVLFSRKNAVVGHGADELYASGQGRIQNADQRATFITHVPPTAGVDRLRVVARDARSGKIGTAEMKF